MVKILSVKYLLALTLLFVTGLKFCQLVAQEPLSSDTTSKFLLLQEDLDSVVSNAIRQKAFPGCVVYATREGNVLFHKSYGFHTYDSLILVKRNDIYDLASLTKILASTLAIMKLYDQGLIHLEDPIGKHINIMGKIRKKTFRELLAHQAGIESWIPFHSVIRRKNGKFRTRDLAYLEDSKHSYKINDTLFLSNNFYERRIKKLIGRSKIDQVPTYKYSGLFFYLVPEIVANLTGQNFEEYLSDSFYYPLGLETMGFNPLSRFDLSRIPPTEQDTFFRNKLIHGTVHDEGAILMQGVSGNAGLFGNAKDVGRLMEFFMSSSEPDSLEIISAATKALFSTTQFPNSGNRRALGFDKPLLVYDPVKSSVARSASASSFGHTGYTGAVTWTDPKYNFVFVFLCNRVYPTRKNKKIYELNLRPQVHQLFYDYFSD
ncbi:MAG: serine hydrolase [Bacteroidota bacterium]